MFNFKRYFTLWFLLTALVLTGCNGGGGGGGSSTSSTAVLISGTAAAGAPVVGYVAVRDSSTNPQPVRTNIPIEANGNYSVDVTGLTPPYAFLASGTVGGGKPLRSIPRRPRLTRAKPSTSPPSPT